ncbi:hypothetical protein NIES25_44060 [Nostoc linckia NIES-25]|nr:hypothetical protein NIES25_44060 [Nostoc linckia NIES-25]
MTKGMKQALFNVLTDAWCPPDLAKEASSILSKYYPDTKLTGATEDEVRVVKQAQEYVRSSDD